MKFARRHLRVAVFGILAVALLALFGPKPSAERFRVQVRQGLERALQRNVEIGELSFTLWGGPGFTLTNVVIADLPAVSAEPFAYVSEVHAALAPASLWRGELIFSRITLTQPSVNIAARKEGGYNFEQMLRRGVGAGKLAGASMPEIVVTGARINFRNGLRKSVYFFRNADLRIAEEETGTNTWLLDFRAEPGRTDSYAPRFGTVRGRGRWRPDAGENGDFDMDVEIERSPLAEVASLFRASRVGLGGYLTARAHLSGPADNLEVRGRLELSEQGESPFFLFPQESEGIAMRGVLDLPARRLHLEAGGDELATAASPATKPQAEKPASAGTPPSQSANPNAVSQPGGTSPESVPTPNETPSEETVPPAFAASLDINPEDSPGEWQSAVSFRGLPVGQVIGLVQYLDDSFPDYPQINGSLSGQVGFHSDTGLRGEVSGDELVWREESGESFRVASVVFNLEGDVVRGRSLFESGLPEGEAPEGSAPAFSFSIDRRSGALAAAIEGKEIRSAHLELLERIAPAVVARPPLMSGEGWHGAGAISWRRPTFRDPGAWSGNVQLRQLRLTPEGFRVPVLLESASVVLREHGGWRIQGASASAGPVKLRLDAAHDPSAKRPYTFTLRFGELSLAQIDGVLALDDQRGEGFLRRTFSLGRIRSPSWPRDRALAAKIYIEKVLIEDSKYQGLHGDLFWDGQALEFRNISAQSRFGPFRAVVRGDLSSSTPSWRWSVQVSNPTWNGGEFHLETSQSAVARLTEISGRISGKGEVVWKRRTRESDSVPSVVRAALEWTPGQRDPRICPGCLEVRSGANVWLGSCNQSNGTGYLCPLEDPRTGQKLEISLPISLVGP